MDQETLTARAADFIASDANRLAPGIARETELEGTFIFEEPLMGFIAADAPYFDALRDSPAAGLSLLLPQEWLPQARTVISFFLPIQRELCRSNRAGDRPSWGWMHARIEGQKIIMSLTECLAAALRAEGHEALIPSRDERFEPRREFVSLDDAPVEYSNWSERHIAYGCALGTFSLNKALITERGMAGRFGSLITTADLAAPYRTLDALPPLMDNCALCGACVRRCPVGALSLETGKDDALCAAWLKHVYDEQPPYYGCGKCQVAVPCETRPAKVRPAKTHSANVRPGAVCEYFSFAEAAQERSASSHDNF
jgi:epoxyqueuosine reductase QueG